MALFPASRLHVNSSTISGHFVGEHSWTSAGETHCSSMINRCDACKRQHIRDWTKLLTFRMKFIPYRESIWLNWACVEPDYRWTSWLNSGNDYPQNRTGTKSSLRYMPRIEPMMKQFISAYIHPLTLVDHPIVLTATTRFKEYHSGTCVISLVPYVYWLQINIIYCNPLS